mgnify:CR=1 FL=1
MMFGFINLAGIVLETLITLSFFRLISTEKRVTFRQEILLWRWDCRRNMRKDTTGL